MTEYEPDREANMQRETAYWLKDRDRMRGGESQRGKIMRNRRKSERAKAE